MGSCDGELRWGGYDGSYDGGYDGEAAMGRLRWGAAMGSQLSYQGIGTLNH